MQDELRVIAEGLAVRLHRAVAIDDPHMRLLAHTAHDEQVDEYRVASVLKLRPPTEVIAHAMSFGLATATEPVRVAGLAERGLLGRVAIPVRCAGHLLGYLWLIDDDETLTTMELTWAKEAAAAAGQVLHRERTVGAQQDSRDREWLRDLLSEDAAARGRAAQALVASDRLPGDVPVVAVCVHVHRSGEADVGDLLTQLTLGLRRTAQQLTPTPVLAGAGPGGDGTLLIAGPTLPSTARLRDYAEQLRAHLVKTTGGNDVTVGIGPEMPDLQEAHRSYRGARDAIRAVVAAPELGPVASHQELGVYRLLLSLPLDALPEHAIPVGLLRLFKQDRSGQLVETLEVYLDEAGDARSAVARLNVHRTSLYYRLSRIETVTGMSLANGNDRLFLHVGLKLARLTGVLPARRGATPERCAAHPR